MKIEKKAATEVKRSSQSEEYTEQTIGQVSMIVANSVSKGANVVFLK
jgi:uncharacterized membrane protein